MKVIDNNKKEERIFALLYGDSGTGKTDFAGRLASMGETLIIDADKGSPTLRKSPRVKPFHDRLTVATFDMFRDLDDAYKLASKNDPAAWSKAFGTTIEKPFEWLVWDSWSSIQWEMMEQLRSEQGLAGSSLVFRKNIQIQHWGMMTDLNKLAIQTFKDLKNINQLFIMLETSSKDEVTGQIVGGPAIHGKMVAETPGYFDVVLRSTVDLSGKYIISSKPKGRFPSKNRLDEGKEIVNPKPQDFFKL